MADKLFASVLFVIVSVFTFFVFDFVRIALNDNVYDNALVILLGVLTILFDVTLFILMRLMFRGQEVVMKTIQCVECSEYLPISEWAWGHECELVDNY